MSTIHNYTKPIFSHAGVIWGRKSSPYFIFMKEKCWYQVCYQHLQQLWAMPPRHLLWIKQQQVQFYFEVKIKKFTCNKLLPSCVLKSGIDKLHSVNLKSPPRACVIMDRPQDCHCDFKVKVIILLPSEPEQDSALGGRPSFSYRFLVKKLRWWHV